MRYLFSLFILIFTISLQAQYERGNWYLSSGSVIETGLQSTVPDSDDFLLNAPSRTGVFLADRLLVGGSLAASAFVRYYQPVSAGSKLAAFAEVNVEPVFGSGGYVSWRPALGIEYLLAEDIFLTARLGHLLNGRRANVTSLEFSVNTFVGRSGLDGKQNLLPRGGFMLDPGIGSVELVANEFIDLLSLNLHFGAGILLSDHLLLEGSISFSNSSGELNNFGGSVSDRNFLALAGDVGLRYFFTDQGKLRPFLAAGGNSYYTFQEVEYNDVNRQDFEQDDVIFTPYLKAGTLLFLTRNAAIDLGVEYNANETDAVFSSRIGFGAGIKLFFGGEGF